MRTGFSISISTAAYPCRRKRVVGAHRDEPRTVPIVHLGVIAPRKALPMANTAEIAAGYRTQIPGGGRLICSLLIFTAAFFVQPPSAAGQFTREQMPLVARADVVIRVRVQAADAVVASPTLTQMTAGEATAAVEVVRSFECADQSCSDQSHYVPEMTYTQVEGPFTITDEAVGPEPSHAAVMRSPGVLRVQVRAF